MENLVIDGRSIEKWDEWVAAENTRTDGRQTYAVSGPRYFGDADLASLRSIADRKAKSVGELHPEFREQAETVRRTNLCLLDYEEHKNVYEIIWSIGTKANELFQCEIFELPERIQLAIYTAEDQGFFRMHMDTLPRDMTRKLSISVPLNDPSEYAGGALEIFEGSNVVEVNQRAGVPVIWPSWLQHRVTPVTSGKRYALVTWFRGPNWR